MGKLKNVTLSSGATKALKELPYLRQAEVLGALRDFARDPESVEIRGVVRRKEGDEVVLPCGTYVGYVRVDGGIEVFEVEPSLEDSVTRK